MGATSTVAARGAAPGLWARLGDPHVILGAGAVAVLAGEAGYRTWTSDAWLLLEAGAALASFAYAWRRQELLRLGRLLGLALLLQASLVALHLGVGFDGDVDTREVFRRQGDALLDGGYPRSEYPLGAVLLFAFESLVSGGATRTANAILMIPFQLGAVAAVWATRTRYSPWLAALVALWPLDAFYREFKFDLVPAALLAVGLVLALRRRWAPAGAVLALGTLAKWTPALAVVALLAWLVVSGRRRAAAAHAAAFAAVVALVHLPFLVWRPSEVAAAYTRQGGRSITPESLWFLILHPFGQARLRTHISFSAGAPRWADVAAVAIQVLLVLLVVGLAARVRSLEAAVALAALAPAVFLLTNRIFSPQFVLVLAVAWAVALALLARSRREQLLCGLAILGASLGNAFVYPFALPRYTVTWQLASALLFAVGLGLTVWLARRAAAA